MSNNLIITQNTFRLAWRLCCFCLFICAVTALAQTAARTRPPALTLGKLAAPPRIDGVMSGDEWAGATKAELNFQIEPGDNIAASEKTEVFLAADRETLFIAFRAYDSDPSAIRARVSKRDDINEDDLVVLMLDKWLVNVWAYLYTQRSKQPGGLAEVEFFDPAIDFQLQRGIQLTYYHARTREGFAGRELSYVYDHVDYKMFAFKKFTITGRADWGGGIFYDPRNPQVGRRLDWQADLGFRPNDKLNVSLLYLKSRLQDTVTGARFFNQEILRNRATYQFTPYHSFRGIFDYDTSLRQFGASLLYAYAPRPNTTFFLGYKDLLFNAYDPLAQRRAPDEGLLRQRRTLFFKLSYNFRF